MKLILPLIIWQHIQGYAIAAAPNEVTGFGTIQQNKDGDFVVDEIFVPKQRSNMTFCETNDGALNDIIFDLVEDNPARAGMLRFRWHSHVDGAVYWSPTDEGDISDWDAPWAVNLVANIFGERKARLDVFTNEIQLHNVELDVCIETPLPVIPLAVQQTCDDEIKEKVGFLPLNKFRKSTLAKGGKVNVEQKQLF